MKNIPNTDLATIERLWDRFSNGKFGYSVQKKKWKQSKNDFEMFCRKIGWTTTVDGVERKKRWFGNSEFTYNVKKVENSTPNIIVIAIERVNSAPSPVASADGTAAAIVANDVIRIGLKRVGPASIIESKAFI